jgi:hypothetical protein
VARLARSTAALDRLSRFQPTRTTLRLRVGETQEAVTDHVFTRARVDVDDEEPAVTVRLLPRGLQISAKRPGTDLIRAQTAAGAIVTIPVVIGSSASLAGIQPHLDCPPTLVKYWGAGTGWAGDQRLYRQLKSPDWCPAVGCGPTALMMLLGWWDANGVPSAFYQLRSGIGQPEDDFRFSFPGLATSDAPKTLPLRRSHHRRRYSQVCSNSRGSRCPPRRLRSLRTLQHLLRVGTGRHHAWRFGQCRQDLC